MDYTFSRSYSSSGALQDDKFQTIVGGTTAGRVCGERHYCPKKTSAAASIAGAGLGVGFAATSDASLSVCMAETMFWTFMTATISGLYAKYSVLIDRWNQINQIDKEHQMFTKAYFKQFSGEKEEAFSDYQDCLRCESEWRKWEELRKWNWKEDERQKWGESLWNEQRQRRKDNIEFKLEMQRQKLKREQERRREAHRRQKYGDQEEAFHHHGVGDDFAWSRTGGGVKDAFGYYALLNLDPAEAWTEKDIKNAFQKRALQCHPDRHAVVNGQLSGKQMMELEQMCEQFQLLQTAYEVLRDPKKKERYDRGSLMRHEI